MRNYALKSGQITSSTGKAILNGFENVINGAYPFKNLMYACQGITSQDGSTPPFPAWLDAHNYPSANPAGRSCILAYGPVPIPTSYSGSYVLGWTGKGKFQLDGANFSVSAGGGFVTGLPDHLIVTGTNARVVFTITGTIPSSLPTYMDTLTAGTFDGTMSGLYLCKLADEADVLASFDGDLSRMFNDDFISDIRTLNPYAIRVMDFAVTNASNSTQPYTLRRPLGSAIFGPTASAGTHWIPSLWAGAISGTTDAFTITGFSAAPVSWTHGEVFQAQFGGSAASTSWTYTGTASGTGGRVRMTLASTTGLTTGQKIANGFGQGDSRGNWTITVVDSTHIELTTNVKTGQASVWTANEAGAFTIATINVNGRGAKLLIYGQGGGGGSINFGGAIVPNACTTFSYDEDFDAVYVVTGGTTIGGLANGPPIEVSVALANKLNCGLWYCFPAVVIDSEVTLIANYVSGALRSSLPAFFEWSNEVWNSGFGQTGIAINKSVLITNGTSAGPWKDRNLVIAWNGYYGFRCAQVMSLVRSAMPRAYRVNAFQAFGGNSTFQEINTYRLAGTGLTNAGNVNPAYGVLSGGVNYNTAPNRPVDICTDLAYAPYYEGAQFCADDSAYQQNTLAAIGGTGQLLWQADKYVNGNSTERAAALAWLDSDVQTGSYAPLTVTSNNYPTTPFTFTYASTAMYPYPAPIYDNQPVTLSVTGGSLPTGFTAGTVYYILNGTATSMQLSATVGGSAINPSSAGTGTVKINIMGRSTMQLEDLGIYPGWETVAASYDSSRNSNGLPLLKISCYEGGCQMKSPSSAILSSMGDASASTDAANCAALLVGYKNSALFRATITKQLKQMMGTEPTSANFGLLPHSAHPCWYQFAGGSQWSLYQGDLYAGTWQSFYGFKDYNS